MQIYWLRSPRLARSAHQGVRSGTGLQEETMVTNTPDTVVVIHGLWMTPLCWEHWVPRYQQRGLKVLAPAWPGMDADVEKLRGDTSGIDRLTAGEVVDHY